MFSGLHAENTYNTVFIMKNTGLVNFPGFFYFGYIVKLG